VRQYVEYVLQKANALISGFSIPVVNPAKFHVSSFAYSYPQWDDYPKVFCDAEWADSMDFFGKSVLRIVSRCIFEMNPSKILTVCETVRPSLSVSC
jgi:hypothetical protein